MQSSMTSSSVGGGEAEAAEEAPPLRFLLPRLLLPLLLLLLLLLEGESVANSLLLPLPPLLEAEAPATPRLRKRRKLALTMRSISCEVVVLIRAGNE